MKKIFFVLLILLGVTTVTVHSQEKGLYLTIDGGLGWTNFNYDLNGGDYAGRLGYGGSLGAQYYFNRHWGISLTGEFYVYNTQSKYDDRSFVFPGQIDDEGHLNDLTIRLRNWKENQTTYFIEIPLMLRYQHKFGEKQMHGLYFGIGAKAQIPIKSTYERDNGSVSVSGYYPEWNLPLGEEGKGVELPQHGYGTNGNRLWSGDNELKFGMAAVAEFGALFGLSRRVDLTLGVVGDYSFIDIKQENNNLVGPVEGTNQQQGNSIAENVYYNGVLNSKEINKINPFSLRGKIGLRIKLGKLKEIEQEEEVQPIVDMVKDPIRDTIVIIEKTIIEKEPQIIKTEPEKDEDGLNEDDRNILKERIFFDLNSSTLSPASKFVLDRKVSFLNRHPELKMRILGNTCDLGNERINVALGLRRANATRNYLIEKGIDPARLVTATQSSHDPLLPNTEEENRALNRRCDFEIDRR